MDRKRQITPTGRDKPTLDDFTEALRQVMLAPGSSRPKSENREPTQAELQQPYKLTRRK